MALALRLGFRLEDGDEILGYFGTSLAESVEHLLSWGVDFVVRWPGAGGSFCSFFPLALDMRNMYIIGKPSWWWWLVVVVVVLLLPSTPLPVPSV